ncbi:hypothetical protein SAMN05421790_10268 [Kroppenstedtia eburnea]|uniref:Uncharacterized protein n=1 Tax=Kroppenstedtia eburnea TaxID=714067 RepID=A0A1N7JGG3_9BACL|nr:hypothetical protein SAMN05421790_10268 [Kroppenstedtia eburnea]
MKIKARHWLRLRPYQRHQVLVRISKKTQKKPAATG